jgi:hypothetical protein
MLCDVNILAFDPNLIAPPYNPNVDTEFSQERRLLLSLSPITHVNPSLFLALAQGCMNPLKGLDRNRIPRVTTESR